MTDDFEDRLSLMLQERVPEPPHVCSAEDVWGRSLATAPGRRRQAFRIAAVVACVAVVGAVAAALSLLGSTQDDTAGDRRVAPATPSRVVTDPSALVGPIWMLRSFQPGSGQAVTVPASAPAIKIAANGDITDNQCDVATSTLSAGRIVFHQGFINGAVSSSTCAPRSSAEFYTDMQVVLGTGTVTWSITADELTVRLNGSALVFHGARADATITGRLLVVGKPNAREAGATSGTVILETAGAFPVTVHVAQKGRFTARVTPGTWTATGSSARLKRVTCTSDAPVHAATNKTTHLDVTCSI